MDRSLQTQPAASRQATSPFELKLPEPGSIGAEISGLDPDVDPATVARIRELVYEHKLVVFHGMDLSDEQYIDFAQRFGRPQVYFQSHYHHPEHPEIFVSSNVARDGKKVGVSGTGRMWHSDYQMFDEPLSTTMVYPKVIPRSRRETWYVDMQRVYEELPDEMRAWVDGARAFHEATYYYKVQPWDVDKAIIELMEQFRRESPGATHPMALTHPVTGKRALYVSSGFTTKIEGLPYEESKRRLDALFAFVERDDHVFRHAWNAGDLMFWDNRTLIHQSSGIPAGEQSCSYRIGVYDDLPFYV